MPVRWPTPRRRCTCGPRRPKVFSSTSSMCRGPAARARRSASLRSVSRSATRSRPGQLRVPHPRVRADGDGVLRARRTLPTIGSSHWCEARLQLVSRPGYQVSDRLRLRAHDSRRAQPLLVGHCRRGVPVPVGLGRARGHRQPGRLRPALPLRALRRAPRVLRPGHRRALRAPRDRAGRGRDAGRHGLPDGRLRHRGGQQRGARRAAARPPAGALPGGGAAAVAQGHPGAGGPPGVRPAQGQLELRLRRDPGHRAPLPPPGRDRHAAVRDRRLRHPRRRRGDGARPRHHGPGPRRHRPPAATTWRTGWPDTRVRPGPARRHRNLLLALREWASRRNWYVRPRWGSSPTT